MLLALSLSMSLALRFSKQNRLRWTFFPLIYAILLVVGIPSGPHLGVELSALFSLILLTSVSCSPGTSAVVCLLYLVGVVAMQREVHVWGMVLPGPSRNAMIGLLFYGVGFAVVCILLNYLQKKLQGIASFRQSVDDASRRLMQANLQLQEYAALSEEEATITERKRLARDLHDTLAYTLTSIIMMMEAGMDLAGSRNKRLVNHLNRARVQAQEGLLEVRKVIEALRPTQMNRVTGLRAIYQLVRTFEKATRIRISLHLRDSPWSFGEEEDIVVYRLVQEGITNALRHGNAKHISIFFAREGTGVRVSIQDNGIGFAEVQEGYGIRGMRERIAKLGGDLELSSSPKTGTILSTWLPLSGQ